MHCLDGLILILRSLVLKWHSEVTIQSQIQIVSFNPRINCGPFHIVAQPTMPLCIKWIVVVDRKCVFTAMSSSQTLDTQQSGIQLYMFHFGDNDINLTNNCCFLCVQSKKPSHVVQFCKKTKSWVDKPHVHVNNFAQSCIPNVIIFLLHGNMLMCFWNIDTSNAADVVKQDTFD